MRVENSPKQMLGRVMYIGQLLASAKAHRDSKLRSNLTLVQTEPKELSETAGASRQNGPEGGPKTQDLKTGL